MHFDETKHNIKKWLLHASAEEISHNTAVHEIAEALALALPTAQLLVNRGYNTPKEARDFLAKEEELFHDPFLLKDMREAAETILDSVKRGDKIAIFGDYDVDGVTSVSILYLYLSKLFADVIYYIPCRTSEGYGMSEASLRKLAADGVNTIITVDTGITAQAEALLLKDLGITLVITDHHECHGELPAAAAVVNPHRPDDTYPFKELAGVGVAFKLLCAMESCRRPEASLGECVRTVAMAYADLVAIGTIADVMPVRDENRLIIALGLQLIERSPREGVRALLDAAASDSRSKSTRKISSSLIGFTIAPRINAAGRIKNASEAVELFLEEDPKKADLLAYKLCDINRERQNEENKIVDIAYARIDAEHDFQKNPVIVLADEHWHHGVIGIVASRITDRYGCPSVLISFDREDKDSSPARDDIGKGSGRSIKGMNLVEALADSADILEKFGGHELAAGLSVRRENLSALCERLNEYAREHFVGGIPIPTVDVDCELTASDFSMRQAEELSALEPFGVENPVPLFATYRMTVSDVAPVGAGKHIRFKLEKDGVQVTAMYFRHGLSDINVYPGDVIDVLYNLDVNEFQGKRSIQLIVREFRLSHEILTSENEEASLYKRVFDAFDNKTKISPIDAAAVLPNRSECGIVYNTLKKELTLGHEVFSMRALGHLLDSHGTPVPYAKLKFILRIFDELRLLLVEENPAKEDVFVFQYVYMHEKTSLEKSEILRWLRKSAEQ
ncbi:MAG: single-stranded-DNA-specific exonuclease RecJ [Clostridia bacterium]|nr:single-stranded-DNA-specific exonuclease RecJ [Clostridia bacterium]